MTFYDKIHRAFQTRNREHLELYHTKTHACAVGGYKLKREIGILSSRALSDTLTRHLKTHTETDLENIYLNRIFENNIKILFSTFFHKIFFSNSP